jgi:exonuclease SbcD
MIKIGHTADNHIDEMTGPESSGQNLRLEDTKRCLEAIADGFQSNQVDLIIDAGDLFDKAKLWSDQSYSNLVIAIDFLRRCASIAPTVLVMGTENHDNPKAYEALKRAMIPNLYIITEPALLTIQTTNGPIQVVGLPAFERGYFLTQYPDATPEEGNAIASQLLGNLVLGFSVQLDPAIPSVLVPHYEIQGCERENGRIATKKGEVVLPLEAIENSNFYLVCAGHIHKAQQVIALKPIYYSGPPTGIGFGEEGQEKGFYIHEVGDQFWNGSNFIKTPYRQFLTITLNQNDVEFFIKTGTVDNITPFWDKLNGAIVRVYYTCTDDQNKVFNRRDLETWLYNQGAFFVHEISPENILLAPVKQEISESGDIEENLEKWLKEYFKTLALDVLSIDPEKELTEILTLARPVILQASAKLPGGRLSGIFELDSLEVKNYRMHRESAIDFTRVKFAMVNGRNGTGKSSLFSDAIIDGFFEDPRSGETGSWITNGETDGMIKIRFKLGSTYQVIRHRKRGKSGKVTLSLQELVGETWEDRSGANKDETQAIINGLLGFDADTLRCIAMIQQGRYDVFFKADRKDRMRIICALLGLNVYEVMMEIGKEQAAVINREILKSQEKIAELNARLQNKEATVIELTKTRELMEQERANIQAAEVVYLKTLEELAEIKAAADQAEAIDRQMKALNAEIHQKKHIQIPEQTEILSKANLLLSQEAAILAGAEEYEQTNRQAIELRAKLPQIEQVKTQIGILERQLKDARQTIDQVNSEIVTLETLLNGAEGIKANAEKARSLRETVENMDKTAKEYREIEAIIKSLKDEKKAEEDRLWLERQTINTKIDQAKTKINLLENSGCIDPGRASCLFLSDAVAAKNSLDGLNAQFNAVQSDRIQELDSWIADVIAKQTAIDYIPGIHQDFIFQEKVYRPYIEQAAQLETKAELLKSYRDQLQKAQETEATLAAEIETLNGQKEALSSELSGLDTLEQKAASLYKWPQLKDKIEAAKQARESSGKLIASLSLEISEKEKQVADLLHQDANRFGELDRKKKEVDERKAAEEKTLQALRDLLAEQVKTSGKYERDLESFQADEEELEKIRAEVEPLAKKWDRFQVLIKACGFDGVPLSVVRGIIPELMARANGILSQMSRGTMSIEVRAEKVTGTGKEIPCLDVFVNEIYSGSLSFSERSGGEQVKAGLSFAFALADIKARRIGIRPAFMIVDEPPFLDEEGSDAYCDALEWLADAYQEMRVIAVSHDPRMKSRFKQEFRLTKTDAGAKVSLVV